MLSPSSIAFAYFYARLLYSVGSHGQAIQECGRALAILNPVDPDKERSWLGGIIDSSQTPEARIANMQQSLCDLVNECVRIIRNKPTDQVLREETDAFHKSNPLQSVIVNTKNLMEPCRRERSAMVPVEQIPENRLEGTLVINQLKNEIAFHKERQKKIKEEKVRLLWNSMSRQEKQSLLRLNMNELLAHFHSSSNNSALKLIKEAFWFAKDHNNWKVWICSSCDMKFVDSELHFQHVMEAHLGRFSQVLQSVLPSRLNSDWQWLICKGTWKPVDPSAALLILTEHSKGFTTRSHMPDEIDYHTDKSPQKHTRGPLTNEVCSDRGSLFVSGRPMSDYSHRSDLLERIRQMLEYLLRAGYLDANHVDKIKQYTMKRLGALYPGLKLSDNQLGQTHICICFLGASQLEEIVKFLDKLSQFAFMLIDHKKSTIAKFLNTHHMGLENKWRIVLNGDSLCLLVGENSLCGESAPKIYTDDDASKAFIPDSGINDIEPPITDVLLRWLFTGPSSEEELKMWLDLDELRKTQEKELHQIIARNGPILFMCDKKYKRLRYREALQAIWRLLFNELTERQLTSNRAHKSFETILSMQQQQLVEESESDISKTKKFTLEVIQNVLNDAQSLGFTYQTVLTSVATDVCDLDIFDNGDLAVQIFLDQADTCIKEVMKKHGNNMELQLMKLESWIMDTVKETEKVRVTINPSAAADYREILWPLAKSCILAKLEEHLEKDETEINKVADKGNVSQAAPKSKKRDNRGGQSKPPQKKPKNSEAKSSESNVQLIVLDQETDE